MTTLGFHDVTVPGVDRPRLRGVQLELDNRDCVFLVGPNGAGKSSLLKSALGLTQPSAGVVRLDGEPVLALSPKERAGKVAWLPQAQSFDQGLSAVEVVTAARYRFAESRSVARAAALDALEKVGAEAFAARSVRQLSGGELQRIKLASLLAQQAPLLLLDEPANHLDPAQQLECYRLLGELWAEEFGLLCVTHDINLVFAVRRAERVRIVGLRDGEVRFDTRLSDPGLVARLGDLFGLPFRLVQVGEQCHFVVDRNVSEVS